MNLNLFLRPEIMSSSFTKHHIEGLGFDAVIHQFDASGGLDEFYHNHPFKFTSFILHGWYKEIVYNPVKDFSTGRRLRMQREVTRYEGTCHTVEPDCIHKIIDMCVEGCTTIITPGPKVQEPGFFDFREDGVYYRQWDDPEWSKYEPNKI